MEPECSLFLPWNLESWALESGIQVQLINNPESSTWNPESMAWIPEFKSVLGSLTWGNHLIFKYLTPPSVMKPATRKDYPLHSFIYYSDSLSLSLSSDVFERQRTSTGSGIFALLSRDFEQIFGQILSIRIIHLTIQIWWSQGLLKEKKAHFRLTYLSKTSLLKLPIN